MDVKNLPAGTILASAGTTDRWRITMATPAMEGATCYRLDFIGKEFHPRVAYSYEIGAGRPFQVVN